MTSSPSSSLEATSSASKTTTADSCNLLRAFAHVNLYVHVRTRTCARNDHGPSFNLLHTSTFGAVRNINSLCRRLHKCMATAPHVLRLASCWWCSCQWMSKTWTAKCLNMMASNSMTLRPSECVTLQTSKTETLMSLSTEHVTSLSLSTEHVTGLTLTTKHVTSLTLTTEHVTVLTGWLHGVGRRCIVHGLLHSLLRLCAGTARLPPAVVHQRTQC